MRCVALIPARGGSKRLPRKNILPFRGRPMIAWTIEAAKKSSLFDDVVVSTEDAEIAEISAAEGAHVITRPSSLADDQTRLVEVFQHSLASLLTRPQRFCALLANCPLRKAEHIVASRRLLDTESATAVLSVVSYGWTPAARAMRRSGRGMEPVFTSLYGQKSQAFPELFCPSGAVFWSDTDAFLSCREIYRADLQPYFIPWHAGIDIDDVNDLKLAEALGFALDHGLELP